MKLPSLFVSLKFRVIALVVTTGLLTAAGTSHLLLDATDVALRRQLLDMNRADAERTADLLGGKLETLTQALVAVARQVPRAAWADTRDMQRYLLDKPALNTLFDGVFAATADGQTLVRLDRGKPAAERPNVADRAYFQQALRTDQPVVSEPVLGKVSGQPLLILSVSVPGEDGLPLGVLSGVVRLQSTSLLSDGPLRGPADGTLNVVVDRRGIVLAHPDRGLLLKPAQALPGLAQVIQRWRDDGSPIDTQSRAELSEGHLVAIAGIPLSDWLHLRVTPEAAAMHPLRAARRESWRAAALAGTLAALLAGGAGWWFVRPITRLRQRALSLMSKQDDGTQTWVHGRDELGDMGRVFEQLLTERRGQQAELQALLAQVESVLDHAEVGIALTVHSRFARVSRRLCDMLRRDSGDLLGQGTRLMHASDAAYDAFAQRARPAFLASGGYDCEIELVRRDGQPFWARMRGRAVVPGDLSAGTIWVVEDVTDARAQRETLSWSASHDALTGLLNRPAFEAALEAAVADERQQPYCALFIDLDRFKQVNDSAGHAAGDALLRGVAQALSASLRRGDVVARLGGDEFAVLLPRCPMQQGRVVGEKLRAAVQAYRLEWQGSMHSVGASLGLASSSTQRHANAAEVLREADAYCYAAKHGGRNQVAAAEA